MQACLPKWQLHFLLDAVGNFPSAAGLVCQKHEGEKTMRVLNPREIRFRDLEFNQQFKLSELDDRVYTKVGHNLVEIDEHVFFTDEDRVVIVL